MIRAEYPARYALLLWKIEIWWHFVRINMNDDHLRFPLSIRVLDSATKRYFHIAIAIDGEAVGAKSFGNLGEIRLTDLIIILPDRRVGEEPVHALAHHCQVVVVEHN